MGPPWWLAALGLSRGVGARLVRPSTRWRSAALVVVSGSLVVALYWPALSLPLMGDDYQWVQHAHHAMHRPLLLLADLDTFFRPANTWALAVDRLLWPWTAAGYHLTNMLLHALAAGLLVLVGRRLGVGAWLAIGVGMLWVATPLSSEPAIQVAIRFESLLLVAWLCLALAWPGANESWTRGRRLAAGAALVLAVMSKETWVVTPVLVLALEMGQRGRGWRDAWRLPAVAGGLAVLYTGLYFGWFPSDKGYFDWELGTLAKVPHQMAAFWGLEQLQPAGFPLTWQGVMALLATAGAVAWSWRRRTPVGMLGGALLFLPMLPTLVVPFLPLRYTAIPYAGFLLVMGSVAAWAWRLTPARWRVAAGVGVAAVIIGRGVEGVVAVRLELVDAAAVGSQHRRLLQEAKAVAGTWPAGEPWALVRGEGEQPLLVISRQVVGWPKTYFVRGADPYGLADGAALFEWVLAREGRFVQRLGDGATAALARVTRVLVHRSGRFEWSPEGGSPPPDLVRAWQAGGAVQVLRVSG